MQNARQCYQLKYFESNNQKSFYCPNTMKLVVVNSKTESLPIFNQSEEEIVATNSTLEKECKIVINMANRCNLKCKYCFASHGTYKREDSSLLSLDAATKIVKDVRKNQGDVHKLIFFGGEPLLNIKKINYICEELSDKVKNFYVVTNGTILSDLVIETLKKYNIIITVSYDGDDGINDLYRGNGNSHKTQAFIHTCLNAGIKPQNLAILTVYSPEHIKQNIKKADLKNKIAEIFPGVTHICQEVNNTSGDLADEFCFSQEMKNDLNREYDEKLAQALSLLDEDNGADQYWSNEMFNIIRTFLFKERKKSFCPDMGKKMMAYDFDGSRYACQMFWGDKEAMHQHAESYNAQLIGLNSKDNYSQCKECWAADYCVSCIKGMGVDPETKQCKIDSRRCEYLKATVDKVLSKIATIHSEKIKVSHFEKQFIKNFDYQNTTYFA